MVSKIDKPKVFNERRIECDRALRKLKTMTNIRCLCDLSWDNFESCKDVIMDETSTKRAKHAVYENARAIRAANCLRVGNIRRFGVLMNESHMSLKNDYEVSCPELDFLVSKAWTIPGVIGSRMHGSGFGGCTVSIVADEAVDEFKEKLSREYEENFGIEPEFYMAEPVDGAREIWV